MNKKKPWKRSLSDESLSVRAHVNAEPPTSVTCASTAAVTAAIVTSSMATATTMNAIPISEGHIHIPNDTPPSVNYEVTIK